MATITEMLNRARSINLIQEGSIVLEDTKQAYLDINRDQTQSGRTNTGELITPSYTEDPFFKSPESALRYSRWKDRITPHPDRPSGTPNLFINGAYQSGWDIRINAGKIEHTGYSPLTSAIEAKFRNIRGLSPDRQSEYKINYFHPLLVRRLKQILYGL